MDVAEELLDVDQAIDRGYVERRLDDGRGRVGQLYARIEGWLPPGRSTADGGVVPIHGDLTPRFAVPEQTPTAESLIWQGRRVGRHEPRGLWKASLG